MIVSHTSAPDDELYARLAGESARHNDIPLEDYTRYKVKRGLRNEDGTGVLVGLTNIATVIGYEKIDEDIVPIDGRLYYRGIDLVDLVEGLQADGRTGFEETAYLLLFGSLPDATSLDAFRARLGEMRPVPKNFPRDVIETFRTPDIMNSLTRSILTLYSQDQQAEDLALPNQVRQSMELIAKINTLAPYSYFSIQHGFHNRSLIIHRPDPALSSAENLLRLLRPDSCYSELEARTIDMAMVLHADHGGGNNSAFTVRVVSSTNTDIYATMAAALGSLKGPLHGGAADKVAGMMDHIRRSLKRPGSDAQLRSVLRDLLKKQGFDRSGKLYGFGHAVYTISDPRAFILRRYAEMLAKEKGREEELDLYTRVAAIGQQAIAEFKRRPDLRICVNCDFYSGFVYDCMGIPREMFTPLFAIARMAGWCAHRLELMANQGKLIRPAYKSIAPLQPYIRLRDRTG